MTRPHSQCLELDLHRLELRFADSRLIEPQAVARLAHSIEQCGQIVPCVVVATPESRDGEGGGASALVLIDGYRRVGALRRLGRDTVSVEQWGCDLIAALLRVLAGTQDRAFATIEQALLLRTLVAEHGLSQHEVARRSGRDVSWVSRRLQLLSGLPDVALAAVRAGRLSSWAANRVIAPLARANPDHAERLLAMLATSPLSTLAGGAGSTTTSRPSGAPASTWSTARACSSTRCRRTRRGRRGRACVPARKANASAICAAWRR